MPSTRKGIERITKQELINQAARLKVQLDAHHKTCYTCSFAHEWPYDMCSKWWTMARRRHNVVRALREYKEVSYPGEVMLPGMENL
jgi:hypothetical protein